MKFIVSLAFVAILAALATALFHMMRGPQTRGQTPQEPAKGRMATALAFRVGLSILLFLCILVAWKAGWIQPTGIPAGS